MSFPSNQWPKFPLKFHNPPSPCLSPQKTNTTMSPKLPLLSFLFLFSLSSLPTPTSSASYDSFVYGGCSQLKYDPNSPFKSNLNSVLASVINSAALSTYNNFTISSPDSSGSVYGLFQCRGDLSTSDCSTCVQHCVSQLGILCLDSAGGTLQLQGCLVKYDNATFLGVEDKTLVLKKCGASMSYNPDLLSRRDEVLTGLRSGAGPFRVSSSAYVQGMAQCVGDLSSGECSDCLSEAIERLSGECVSAASGDVYLAKCYARYSTGGIYNKPPNSDSEDEAGKTLAIIIGLLAGVAVIIIFLSFMRKVFEGKGGK